MTDRQQNRIFDALCTLSAEDVARAFTDWHGMQLIDDGFASHLVDSEYFSPEELGLEADPEDLDAELHDVESTHTIEEVLKAWEIANEPYKVSRLENGKPSGLMLFAYRRGETSLDFEYLDEDGEVQSETLFNDDVFELVGDSNSTEGAWTGHDEETDVFECWRGRD